MSSLRVLFAAVLLTACATGGDGGMDSGTTTRDGGGTDRDGTTGTDSGSGDCPSGQHACGAGCIDDLENIPANGCRYGCGEPCPTPPDGEASCDAAGMCTVGCEPPFSLIDGMCVCMPRTCEDWGHTCGSPDDGCGTPLDCGTCLGGGVCVDGSCTCAPDAQEPNDSRTLVDAQPFLARMNDADNDDMSWDAFNMDVADDEDWYRFDVDDGTDGGAPVISAWITNIPTGSDYDLTAFWTCDDGTPGEGCNVGTPDSEIGFGCASRSSGNADEHIEIDSWCGHTFGGDPGVLYVRVRTATFGGSCDPYTLRVRVE